MQYREGQRCSGAFRLACRRHRWHRIGRQARLTRSSAEPVPAVAPHDRLMGSNSCIEPHLGVLSESSRDTGDCSELGVTLRPLLQHRHIAPRQCDFAGRSSVRKPSVASEGEQIRVE
jgi:hypothetical protein